MPHRSQHTWDLPNLSYDCNLWNTLSFDYFWHSFGLLGLLKWRIIEPSFAAFIGFPFPLVLHVRSRNALLNITKYKSSTGIIKDYGYSLKCVLKFFSRPNFAQESSFKGTPLNWALTDVFEDLDFLSHNYCEQNKTTCSDIYQQHHHLNIPLDQNLHLLPQAHQNSEISLM